MAKRKPEPRAATPEAEFILVTIERGHIESATYFRSPVADAYHVAKARATRAGAKMFQVYRINVEAGTLAFMRVEG